MTSRSLRPVRVWTHIVFPALLLVLAIVVLLPLAKARTWVRDDLCITAPDVQLIADTMTSEYPQPTRRGSKGAER